MNQSNDLLIGPVSTGNLRIAFGTPEYVTEEYFDGGLANYTHRVARALADRGHDVHVLTSSEIDDAEFRHEGVTVHRLKKSKYLVRPNHGTRSRVPSTIQFLDFSSKVYRKLRRLNAEQPFQLVQFPNYSFCGFFSILFLPVPHVLRASSYQPALNAATGVTPTLDSRAVKRLDGLQFRLSRHIFAPSYNLQKVLAERARLSRVRVIPTPFYVETLDWDHSIFDQFLKGKKYLLFFGRFQLHKGFHTLVRAVPGFLEKYPDAWVAVVGRDMESKLAPSMAEYARKQCGRFAERLVVIERLPHAQLYPVISGAHLVVLPSLIENLPNACLEAMGLGKVVIGTTGTSFDELITESKTGFLVPPNDAKALAEGIINAWIHPRLEEIGAAARRKISEFSPERTIETLLAFYGEVLSEHKHGRQ